MNNAEIEVLMVEDNPDDAALALRALKKNHLLNRIHVVNDGAQVQQDSVVLDRARPRRGLDVARHPATTGTTGSRE